MRLLILLILASFLFSCGTSTPEVVFEQSVAVYLTDPAAEAYFEKGDNLWAAPEDGEALPTIAIDLSQKFQTMDGFGFTLNGGSAALLQAMSPSARKSLLTELFATDEDNIGVSYLRLSVGASDLDAKVFSYNDLPPGQTDVDLDNFSLAPDRIALIPTLKAILAINPDISLMASPWSPPVWMKDNGSSIGGSLKPEYYPVYANYLVRYVQEMEKEGITIDALTIQNEPLHPGNNPSLLMLAEDQLIFVRDHLGPAFEAASLKTKIVVYDHNADRPDYPITILNDPEAAKYIDGSAFHLYGGDISALTEVHNAYPDKNLYFTEQWIGAPGDFAGDFRWHTKNLIIGAPANWAKTVLEWNLAADPEQNPHTEGGCTRCLGAVTIDGDSVTKNPAWYIIAQAAKFVRPGAVRVGIDTPENLPAVAYLTLDEKIVLIVLNDGPEKQFFRFGAGEDSFIGELASGAAGTFVWE